MSSTICIINFPYLNLFNKVQHPFISVQQCLQLMTELDDDLQQWLEVDDTDDEMEEETATAGETALDRIACTLGGKAVMAHALQCINELLNSDNW